MKVAELRKLLEAQPDDADVWSEGCDCSELAGGIEYLPESNAVEIKRDSKA